MKNALMKHKAQDDEPFADLCVSWLYLPNNLIGYQIL